MRVARTELYAGRALLLALIAITILPFLSMFTTALHPSGTLPSGLEWPADPQWGNFFEAFNVANMTALLASSVFIVLAVVPVSLVISTMAGFAIGLLRIPGSRSPAAAVHLRADAAVRGDHHPAVLPRPLDGHPQHAPRDRASADRAVHAVRGVLDAGALREHADRDHGGGQGRRRQHLGPVLADPRPACPGADRVARAS